MGEMTMAEVLQFLNRNKDKLAFVLNKGELGEKVFEWDGSIHDVPNDAAIIRIKELEDD